ncbi:dickkopf-related protein 2-like [Phyllopteryx taeniolatus]|uniref:dickkopf-related protein 2-like n=1 Tax=Phyllopteryx taeniolatus TaxID=161469 RepID=UPI002AD58D37|nr:dickkopf-related protein 2-like [Phyllopteryx taeniolatus]
MTRNVDALLCALSLATVACARDVRVRLNSIRTVVVHKGPAVSFNGSAWELTHRQCISDLECSEGSYCHAPYRGPAHSSCRTCRRRKKRCHRDGMCCPGNLCSNSVCVPDGDATASQQIAEHDDWASAVASPKARWSKMEVRGASGKGQVGDPCLAAADCSDGLCCARHFWTRICKPVLHEGQVCSRQRGKQRRRGLELFQRCPCGEGLACRTPPGGPRTSAAALPPSLAAAKSKFAAYSRRPTPLAAKTRLHECQRK